MDCNALLVQEQRLTIRETREAEDVPAVERTVEVVLEERQKLHASVAQMESMHRHAAVLFGFEGMDLSILIQQVNILSLCDSFKALKASGEKAQQNPGSMQPESESQLVAAIDEVNEKLKEEASRRKCNQEEAGLPECSASRSQLNYVELCYASAVHEYNDDLLAVGYRRNLVKKFAWAAEYFKDEHVNDMWTMLAHMVEGAPPNVYNADPIRMRQQTPGFLQKAKHYLEHRYRVYMSWIVHSTKATTKFGRVPNSYNLICAYVSVDFKESPTFGHMEHVKGKPLWPHVYYAIRSGDLRTAQSFLCEAGKIYEDFLRVLEDRLHRPEESIDPKLEAQLKLQYIHRVKGSADPYKQMAYCIILGCDEFESHAEVVRTIDDFLWMQLSLLCAQVPRDHNHKQVTYAGLQVLLLEYYGESYFNVRGQPHIYFQVLVLSGQFEVAIEYLARHEAYRAHAVHMALALNELSLLGAARCVRQPLLSVDNEDPRPLRRLNLVRLLLQYVQRFESTYVGVALQYFYFLRGFTDSEGRNVFLKSVSDLAVATGAHELMFGWLDTAGSVQVSRGLLVPFTTQTFTLSAAAVMVAEEFLQRGHLEPAVLLFHAAGRHNEALKHLSSLLAQVVHQQNRPGSVRARVAFVAANYNASLLAHQIAADPQLVATFALLCELLSFFDLYNADLHWAALQVLARTKLVPMSGQELDACVMRFMSLSVEMYKVMPHVLFAAMNIFYAHYKKLRDKNAQASQKVAVELQQLREVAQATHSLAIKEPNRMPADACNQLLQVEILMHYMTAVTRRK